MVARLLYHDEVMSLPGSDPATGAYAVTAIHVLPNGLMGIMIAAMFAATMSSMDTGINGQTGIIVNNLLARIRETLHLPALGGSTLVRLCRFISAALGLVVITISLLLASQGEIGLFDIFLLIGSVIGVPLMLPLFFGLFIRRLPSWSYFAIAGAALGPSLYSLIDARFGGSAWTIQDRGTWVIAFGAAAALICIPLARYSSTRQRERESALFSAMTTPINFASEIGESRDAEQAQIVGRVTLLLGALMTVLLALPNSLVGRLVILALIGYIITVGGLLLWAARAAGRRNDPSTTKP